MSDPIQETQALEEQAVPYDASDPKAVNNARKRAARKRVENMSVLKTLMSTKAGREWVYNLLLRCHIYETSFVQGDMQATSFKEGERNIGLSVVSDLMDGCPKEYLVMCNEAKLKGLA